MKRGLVFVLLVVFSYGFSFAQEVKDKKIIGLDAVYVWPEDAEYKEDINPFVGRLSLGYGLNDNLVVELEGGAFKMKSKHHSKTSLYTVMCNAELRASAWEKFVPYLLGGVGVAFFSYDDLHPTETKDKSSSFAWKGGLGVEYFLADNWAVNAEAAYFYANTGGGAHLDVYGRHYSLGVKCYF